MVKDIKNKKTPKRKKSKKIKIPLIHRIGYSQKKYATILRTIFLTSIALSIIGVIFYDWHYRNLPKEERDWTNYAEWVVGIVSGLMAIGYFVKNRFYNKDKGHI